jgi:hypothetical protein
MIEANELLCFYDYAKYRSGIELFNAPFVVMFR